MSGEIHKNTPVDFNSFMLARKAWQVGAETTYNNSLKNLQGFVSQKGKVSEWSIRNNSNVSVFLNNENS